MYLLDTNVVSELRKGSKADQRVVAWAERTDVLLMHLSVISVLEIRMGILSLQRKSKEQAGVLNSGCMQTQSLCAANP